MFCLDGGRKETVAPVDQLKLQALFDQFKGSQVFCQAGLIAIDPDVDAIGIEGTEQLCEALEVDPTDIVTLVLAWHLKCENACEFKRDGWIQGWTALGCDSLEKMKGAILIFRKELENEAAFKEIYQFAFNFAKQDGQRSLALDQAVAYWGLLLDGQFQYLDLWTEYVQEHYKKSISKDTWNLFLDFVRTSEEKFNNHDSDGAWPVLIDEFAVPDSYRHAWGEIVDDYSSTRPPIVDVQNDIACSLATGTLEDDHKFNWSTKNLSATCYMNAFLQVWYHDLGFRKAIYAYKPSTNTLSNQIFSELQYIFCCLESGIAASYSPARLAEVLKIQGHLQQDAHEFGKLFLTYLDSVLTMHEKTIDSASILLTKPGVLEDCLAEHLKDEKLTGENKYFCSNCKSVQDGTRSTKITKLPSVLSFQLLRFVYNREKRCKVKIKQKFIFPEYLDAHNLMDTSKDKDTSAITYKLNAAILHFGETADSGHYVSSKAVYLLIYKKSDGVSNGATISVEIARPPVAIVEQVNSENAELLSTISSSTAREEESKKLFETARKLRLEFASEFGVLNLEDSSIFVPTSSLKSILSLYPEKVEMKAEEEMVDRGLLATKPRTLDCADLQCAHQKMNPLKVHMSKRLRTNKVEELSKALDIAIEPLLYSTDLCHICASECLESLLVVKRHEEAVSLVSEILEEDSNSPRYIVSDSALKKWMSAHPSLNETKAADKHSLDWCSDLLCIHKNLHCEVKRRIGLSFEAFLRLQSIIDNFEGIDLSEFSECEICMKDAIERKQAEMDINVVMIYEREFIKNFLESEGEDKVKSVTNLYMISTAFARQWRKNLSNSFSTSPLSLSLDAPLLCPHDLPLYDIREEEDWSENDFFLTTGDGWNFFSQRFQSKVPILVKASVDDCGNLQLLSDPPFCGSCRIGRRLEKKSASITIQKVLKKEEEASKKDSKNDHTFTGSRRSRRLRSQFELIIPVSSIMTVLHVKLKNCKRKRMVWVHPIRSGLAL
ncbi:DCN1-like protein 1 [Dinochytrium kinnereticum]|nr:DCN1-like protein 1 [Dinochytrium kinnereticum]